MTSLELKGHDMKMSSLNADTTSSKQTEAEKAPTKLELAIVGARYCMPGDTDEERTTAATDFLSSLPVGTRFILSKRPDNPYNPDAVACMLEADCCQYGFVSDEQLFMIQPCLDDYGQCDAVLSHTDGHITYWVEVEVSDAIPPFNPQNSRILSECPLPHKFMMECLPDEMKMDILPQRFIKTPISEESLPDLYQKADMLLNSFNLSLCRSDAHWQREIQRKIRQIDAFVQTLQLVKEPSTCFDVQAWFALSDRCQILLGDYHRVGGHGQILKKQFDRLFASGKADLLSSKVSAHYQEELGDQLNLMADWFKSNLNVYFSLSLDWKELGHSIAYKKLSRSETYEILTVLVLLHKLSGARTPKVPKCAQAQKTMTDALAKEGIQKLEPVRKSALPKINRKSGKEQEKPREGMTFCKNGILEGNIKLLYSQMIESKWIGPNTPEQDFVNLFSGELSDCRITWSEKYGKGTLVFLFKFLESEQVITVPKGYTIPHILMGHFVDKNGDFLTNLDKGDPVNDKAGKECMAFLNTLRTTAYSTDSHDKDSGGYDDACNPYDLESDGLRYRGNKHGSGRNSGMD